jgi:hypothetical protein
MTELSNPGFHLDNITVSDIFISYSRNDKEFVQRLFQALEDKGRNPWVDWEGIPPSAKWLREIFEAIDKAEAFLFILSSNSVASRVCNQEVERALESGKRIIPVVCKDIDAENVRPELARLNWVLLRSVDDFAKGLDDLVEAIETDPDAVRDHTRILVRAREWESNTEDKSFLLRGRELKESEAWLDGQQSAEKTDIEQIAMRLRGEREGQEPSTDQEKLRPTDLHVRYILASRQNANRFLRRLFITFGMAFVLVLAGGATAYWQWGVAEDRGRQTRRTLALSDFFQADELIEEKRPTKALAFLARATRQNPDFQNLGTRTLSLLQGRTWLVEVPKQIAAAAEFIPDVDTAMHPSNKNGIYWTFFAQQDLDKVVDRFQFSDEAIEYGAVSPGAKLVATMTTDVGEDPTWKLTLRKINGQVLGDMAVDLDSVLHEVFLRFSEDGKHIVVFGGWMGGDWVQQGICYLLGWEWSGGGRDVNLRTLARLQLTSFASRAVAFSPGSAFFAVSTPADGVYLYDAQSGRFMSHAPPIKPDSARPIIHLKFSSDDAFLREVIHDDNDNQFIRTFNARRLPSFRVKEPQGELPPPLGEISDPNEVIRELASHYGDSSTTTDRARKFLSRKNFQLMTASLSPDKAWLAMTDLTMNFPLKVYNVKDWSLRFEPIVLGGQYIVPYFAENGEWMIVKVTDGEDGLGHAQIFDNQTGKPLSGPLPEDWSANRISSFEIVGLSADGRKLGLVYEDSSKGDPWQNVVYEIPWNEHPVPGWVADLAEALGGLQLDENNVLQLMSPEKRHLLLKEVENHLQKSIETKSWEYFGKRLLSARQP